jgi:tubulin monoglycylase TTLL3/8
VIVTDWNPLKIWFYDECYIRFCAEDYDPKNLNNPFAHLTNNSIAKNSENADNPELEENMWSMEQFSKYLEA